MARLRRITIQIVCCVFAGILILNCFNVLTASNRFRILFPQLMTKYPAKYTLESSSLTEQQCRTYFPLLDKEIDRAVARGPFKLEKEPDDYTGLVQGRIRNGKLYIITSEHKPAKHMRFERDAVLQQIHRAIVTSPEPLPDTIFTLTILDTPHQNAWSFSRSNDPNHQRKDWVMPHFSFWSWPLPFIGTVDEALANIDRVEKGITWDEKIDKVAWRGTAHFNSIENIALRPKLLAAAKGKHWADVATLDWESNAVNASNAIRVEDFCKYKYIIYTEGVTYSGRLQYHQACGSIIITPPVTYMMHNTHLMRPLFSSSLPFSPSANSKAGAGRNPRWPESYSPSEANIIFVDPDWADLEQTVEWLQSHSSIAEGMANRQRKMVVEAGYLSPASEACYWRSLIRGWNSVVSIDEEVWGKEEGVRFETYSLKNKENWD